ncbi:nucleotidyltransferase family protein [Deinococcus radiotolerans]|uniref:Nucleotidyltransferase family protein n=1 Tax=Deinococcus radiotolerans TaxID=1309407 RepID=A0ABQ2FJC9_9DEIO|nr:nucleotidyltransferase family protein [Deinococcus radiotolerans]GGK93232.1 hypothetical protein GCM10010844_09620 [Deinococcus radiotolerans]
MTEQEFLRAVHRNPVNAAILERLPHLHAPQAHLTAGALFGTVWNLQSGQPPGANIADYDLFYWDADLSYDAEDAVIRRAATLFADLPGLIEVRNQARVHLWFREKTGLERPALGAARDGIDQFLVECTALGIDAHSRVYAPFGLHDLTAGRLRLNRRNHTPGLYRAKVDSYRRRWPWLTDEEA